jgi:hypothetical protein
MAASVTGRAINRDWEERDFVESMQVRYAPPATGAARSRRHCPARPPLTPPSSSFLLPFFPRKMNILKMTEFLNRFDTSTRFRLAKLNEKLSRLERSLDYVEAAIKPREEGGGGGGA